MVYWAYCLGGGLLIHFSFQKDLCIEELESTIMEYRSILEVWYNLTMWACYLSFSLVWSIQTNVYMWFQNLREDKNNLGQELQLLQHKLIVWVERHSMFLLSLHSRWLVRCSTSRFPVPTPITALCVVLPVPFSTRTLWEFSTSLLSHLGGANTAKHPKAGCFLPVIPEPGSLRSECHQGWVLVRTSASSISIWRTECR